MRWTRDVDIPSNSQIFTKYLQASKRTKSGSIPTSFRPEFLHVLMFAASAPRKTKAWLHCPLTRHGPIKAADWLSPSWVRKGSQDGWGMTTPMIRCLKKLDPTRVWHFGRGRSWNKFVVTLF